MTDSKPAASGSSISEQLANHAAGFSLAAVPDEVRRQARYLILDAIGVAFASSTYDFARTTVAGLETLGHGEREVIGFPVRLPMRDAVLANGALIHGIDFDDTHLVGVVHPTSSCLPTAMAVAAQFDLGGEDMLGAYILGIEMAARIGAVAKGELNQIGFHPTGVVAAFAAALVAGRLLGLDRRQLTMAQGIALSMASGTREYSAEGAWTKRLHPGWAGGAGVTSAILARQGFVGPRKTYEGRFGLYATHLGTGATRYDLALATQGLGSKWELMGVAIKPLPACQLSIACIDAALAITADHAIDPRAVATIEALVPAHAVAIVCEPAAAKLAPQSSYDAQFSLPFCVACALIRQRFGIAETELFTDADILALAAKVSYRVDPNSGYPRHFSGEVIVTMANGDRWSNRQPINRGAEDNPLSHADIEQKFLANARLALSQARAEEVLERVLQLGNRGSARDLAAALVSS